MLENFLLILFESQPHHFLNQVTNPMKTETLSPLTRDEQKLIDIIRRLPTGCVSQRIEFAKFLDFKRTYGNDENVVNHGAELREEGKKDPWDTLLTQPAAKSRLRELAQEALAEEMNGHTTEIIVTKDGRQAPA
jgi:hypothetical protein